jgi:hypothetical protein
MNLSTDLLAGSDRRTLQGLRERADKAGCACLLLVEPNPQQIAGANEATIAAAVTRMRRVVEAAHALGCSSAAFSIAADDNDATLAVVAPRLKAIAQEAERLDINVLLSPYAGLTSQPERLTELLKKIGGFRVGTFPDFQTASAAKDPVAYLRRLTPYAAVVSASTLTFEDAEVEVVPEPPKPKPKGGGAKAASAKAAAAAKKDEAPVKPAPVPEDEEDDLDELSAELDPDELARIDADLDADGDAEVIPEPVPRHLPYDLDVMVGAVASVGYDATLAIDYRGQGDPVNGVRQSRRALLAALEKAAAGE